MYRAGRDESGFTAEQQWAWDFVLPYKHIPILHTDALDARRLAEYAGPLFKRIAELEKELDGMYNQCLLEKGTTRQTAWIPKKFAVKGKVLDLKADGVWEEGWRVLQAGVVSLPEEVLRERSQDYKRTRKASDA